MASDPITVTVPLATPGEQHHYLNNLPTGGTQYSQMRVYRTTNGGSNFFLLNTQAATGSFVDNNSTALTNTALNNTGLSGNYSYMVTYYRAGEPESKPSPLLGPINIVNGRVHLDNFPTPPTPPTGGGFPAYDQIRIYRNLSNDSNSFYLVDTVAPGASYTDGRTDAEIKDLNVSGNRRVDLDGPVIDSRTLLVNVTLAMDLITPILSRLEHSLSKLAKAVVYKRRRPSPSLPPPRFKISKTS